MNVPYRFLDTLQLAYELRLKKKFEGDKERMKRIMRIATGNSPLAIMRELRKLDDEEK